MPAKVTLPSPPRVRVKPLPRTGPDRFKSTLDVWRLKFAFKTVGPVKSTTHDGPPGRELTERGPLASCNDPRRNVVGGLADERPTCSMENVCLAPPPAFATTDRSLEV